MNGNDAVFDFMTEQEVAEILATEELLDVEMDSIDDLLADVATDSDYE